ncbi:hypothetical protein AA103196_2584 [Ameyamaea chiangmaiensis NBRC 103196]|uniref:Uncharacterized protein n=1 Tax=Ameyamaea chiangmaiensis TaxID=442969 RepID=A0A850P6V8_9PROT|nr:hypothetical protein [Ameyamaea chiangmaiensis]MBS4075614.1 hypothetical protein [Ameyamaea chiangmaiensis]NVN40365.1 hypothetical protein [Ameyamaea chiangmaiensis]GBQ70753.1 hypothetical protein AA103196_2584 [Ameyamaea chiangmaiensis NBRC 103196]
MMPLIFPDWVPWWLQLALLLGAFLLGVAFLLMPFAVFGVKGRLAEVELELGEVKAELRVIAARLGASEDRGVAPGTTPVSGRPDTGPTREARPRPTRFEPPPRAEPPPHTSFASVAHAVPPPSEAWGARGVYTSRSNSGGTPETLPWGTTAPDPVQYEPVRPWADAQDREPLTDGPGTFQGAAPRALAAFPIRGESRLPTQRAESAPGGQPERDRSRAEPTLRWPPRG